MGACCSSPKTKENFSDLAAHKPSSPVPGGRNDSNQNTMANSPKEIPISVNPYSTTEEPSPVSVEASKLSPGAVLKSPESGLKVEGIEIVEKDLLVVSNPPQNFLSHSSETDENLLTGKLEFDSSPKLAGNQDESTATQHDRGIGSLILSPAQEQVKQFDEEDADEFPEIATPEPTQVLPSNPTGDVLGLSTNKRGPPEEDCKHAPLGKRVSFREEVQDIGEGGEVQELEAELETKSGRRVSFQEEVVAIGGGGTEEEIEGGSEESDGAAWGEKEGELKAELHDATIEKVEEAVSNSNVADADIAPVQGQVTPSRVESDAVMRVVSMDEDVTAQAEREAMEAAACLAELPQELESPEVASVADELVAQLRQDIEDKQAQRREIEQRKLDIGPPVEALPKPASSQSSGSLKDAGQRITGTWYAMADQAGGQGLEDNITQPINLYITSVQAVRKTYEDCKTVRNMFLAYGCQLDVKDISMSIEFKEELKGRMGGSNPPLPRVFIGAKYLGGFDDILHLNETDELKKILDKGGHRGQHKATFVCQMCGNHKFLPCMLCNGSRKIYDDDGDVYRCPDCNENGLVRCVECCPPSSVGGYQSSQSLSSMNN